MLILIIENDVKLSDRICEFLTQHNYTCDKAINYDDAVQKLCTYSYDCILIDLNIQGNDGLNLIRIAKANNINAGLIAISSNNSIDDKVDAMKLGADDFLSKPLNFQELNIRIYALLRLKHFDGSNIIIEGDIKVNLLSKQVTVGSDDIYLTKSEYRILLFLLRNKGNVVSKISLAENLSGERADMMDDYKFVYYHIKNLRAKLFKVGRKDLIHTIYGFGYKWG